MKTTFIWRHEYRHRDTDSGKWSGWERDNDFLTQKDAVAHALGCAASFPRNEQRVVRIAMVRKVVKSIRAKEVKP